MDEVEVIILENAGKVANDIVEWQKLAKRIDAIPSFIVSTLKSTAYINE